MRPHKNSLVVVTNKKLKTHGMFGIVDNNYMYQKMCAVNIIGSNRNINQVYMEKNLYVVADDARNIGCVFFHNNKAFKLDAMGLLGHYSRLKSNDGRIAFAQYKDIQYIQGNEVE